MQNEFVKYETALALKELGFDESCLGFYDGKGNTTLYFNNKRDASGDFKPFTKTERLLWFGAPLYQQAFRWFREKYELFGEIIMIIPEEGSLDGCITYVASVSNIREYKKCPKITNEYFPTYEKAESACLDKLIELVKNEQSK